MRKKRRKRRPIFLSLLLLPSTLLLFLLAWGAEHGMQAGNSPFSAGNSAGSTVSAKDNRIMTGGTVSPAGTVRYPDTAPYRPAEQEDHLRTDGIERREGPARDDDMTPLSDETMTETLTNLGQKDIVPAEEDPYELYYLYHFLYIGDSFIERLARSGILHESCQILAKSGSAARDWYVSEDNDDYVDYLEQMKDLKGTDFSGIVINYGINDIKNSSNVEYSKQLIQDVAGTFPDVPVFILKIVPVAEHFSLTRQDKLLFTSEEINRGGNNNVTSFNATMERFCRTVENVYFVDATKGFVDEDGNLKADLADKRGLHIADPYVVDWCKNIFEAVTSR